MREIDQIGLECPFYGSRRMTAELVGRGYCVNRKRLVRLMRLMGHETVYAKPSTSQSNPQHRKYAYLLRDVPITHADQVWSSDITTLPMKRGFLYLVAVMDWTSRFVLGWQLSNALDTSFCIEALEDAFSFGQPLIFSSDQGCQYTSIDFTQKLENKGVAIRLDGRGRFWDNIWVERLWRTLEYEEVTIKEYADGIELYRGLSRYFSFYNHHRRHQALDYRTPADLYPNAHIQPPMGHAQ